MNIVVLLTSNDINDNNIADSSYNSNVIDLSLLPKGNISLKYLTLTNYHEIINNIDNDAIIINLCDGTDTDGHPGLNVVKLLDELNLVYTGCSPKNYECKKSMIKNFNVSTPKYILLDNISTYDENTFNKLKYPLIIKPDYGGGSDGITTKSKVNNYQELKLRMAEMITYNLIMIEEFIEGREFTVLITENANDIKEPYVLEPMECIFLNGETFKHYDLKWGDSLNMQYKPIHDSALQNKIMQFCKDIFVLMDIDSYVRFDLRMDVNEKLYINDINSYCAMFYPMKEPYGSADLILKNSKIMNHKSFLEEMIQCAKKRVIKNRILASQNRNLFGQNRNLSRQI